MRDAKIQHWFQNISRICGLLAAVLLLASGALADVKPAAIFADHMVLQREKPVAVWGTASPGEKVTVSFAGQSKNAAGDAVSGNWRVTLEAMPVSAEPRQMTISGNNEIKISDVLVGEVWVYAGGLNVATGMLHLADKDVAIAEAKGAPAMPTLRCFSGELKTSREVQPDVRGRWLTADADSMGSLNAGGYYLGRKLVAELGVPVGIVNIAMAWPGEPIETWMSREALAAIPAAKPIVDFYASDEWKKRSEGTYEARVKEWMELCQKLPLNPPPKPQPNEVENARRQEPAAVWNAMVAPLTRLAIRGIVFDHGEDEASLQHAEQYGKILQGLIANWRQTFGDVALPFVVVQLRPTNPVPRRTDSRLAAELRDAQSAAAAATKAALVVNIDLPQDPHPRDVSPRIASTILAKVYNKEGVHVDGPQLASTETVGNKVILHFRNTQGGLVAKGGAPKGFAIASSLLRWVWADAVIKGDTIEVSAPTVDKPEGVRYAYQDAPRQGANLYNGVGCPARPFRTDSFVSCTAAAVKPGDRLRYNSRGDLAVENPRLPRILIIGDSISGGYMDLLREGMRDRANVIGEASMRAGTWASMEPDFYRADWASRGDGLRNFLKSRGPFDIVHFNNGIHNFSHAKPGDEKPYAQQLKTVVAIIREAGAIPLFGNSTGTVGDNMIKDSPNYLSNCKRFNAAAEAAMRELNVPVTDIYGVTQPRIKELIGDDLIHVGGKGSAIIAEAIMARLNQTLDKLPAK